MRKITVACMTSTIERELVVGAPIGRVWEAVTSPAELRRWFGDVAELDLRPGGRGRFGWTEFGDEIEFVVETVEPPHLFSYRWSAAANATFDRERSTLVTFRLADLGGSTRITLTETGFDELPPELAGTFDENCDGWTHELADLLRHLEPVAPT